MEQKLTLYNEILYFRLSHFFRKVVSALTCPLKCKSRHIHLIVLLEILSVILTLPDLLKC